MPHHFIIELTYRVTFDELADILPEHRRYLQAAYDRGQLLFSGPQLPKTGGIIVARMNSIDEVRQFFADDPFQKNGLADYRIFEFDMVKRQAFMDQWALGE